MKLTYYGHSCFSVQTKGINVLFDPFISGNILAKDINIDEILADYIVVSHGHFDHILDAVSIAKRTSATVIANFEITTWLSVQGISNIHTLNPGGKFRFDFGLIKCFMAQHSSSFPDGTYAGVACGFLIESGDGNFYYSGDTGLSLDMQLVGQAARLDFAILPIGDNLTMGIEEAIKAANLIDAKEVIGVHFDTFPQIKIDTRRAIKSFEDAGLKLNLIEIGQTVVMVGN